MDREYEEAPQLLSPELGYNTGSLYTAQVSHKGTAHLSSHEEATDKELVTHSDLD